MKTLMIQKIMWRRRMMCGDGDDEKLMLSIHLRMKRKQMMVKMVKMMQMLR